MRERGSEGRLDTLFSMDGNVWIDRREQDARREFQSIDLLQRQIVHYVRRPAGVLHLAHRFGGERVGRGRNLRGKEDDRYPGVCMLSWGYGLPVFFWLPLN
jgi:hypothetical protein